MEQNTLQTIQPEIRPEIGHWIIDSNTFKHIPVDSDGNKVDQKRGRLRLYFPKTYSDSFTLSVDVHWDTKHSIAIRTAERFQEFTTFSLSPEQILLSDDRDKFFFEYPEKNLSSYHIKCVCDHHSMTLYLNNQEIGSIPRSHNHPYRFIEFFTPGESLWENLKIEIAKPIPLKYIPTPSKELTISTSCDFQMDLLRMGLNFRKQSLHIPGKDWSFINQYMQTIADTGVKKVNWITCQSLPDEVNQLAIKAAHRAGMKIFATIKLFDVGDTNWLSRDANTDHASLYGYDHPEVYSLRAPLDESWSDSDAPIQRICIYKDDQGTFDHSRLSIWVSDDGKEYKPYCGTIEVHNEIVEKSFQKLFEGGREKEKPVRRITFNQLDIKQKYFAIACSSEGKATFLNRLHRLFEVFDSNGKRVHLQHGLQLQLQEKIFNDTSRTKGTLTFNIQASDSFPQELLTDFNTHARCHLNFLWNKTYVLTNSKKAGFDDMEVSYPIDNDISVIGLKRDYEPKSDRTFSPAVPAAREFFINWIEQWLDWGVDGIDIRVRGHARTPCVSDLHFNPEVAGAYEKKYGEALTLATVDREKHQRLMGEFYTSLIQQISEKVHRRSKQLYHHINPHTIADPAKTRCLLGIHFDWKTWIKKGYLDGITLKEVLPKSDVFDEVMPIVKKAKIPAFLSVHILNLLSTYDYATHLKILMQDTKDYGLEGYDIYEASSFIHGDASENSRVILDKVPSLIKEMTESKS